MLTLTSRQERIIMAGSLAGWAVIMVGLMVAYITTPANACSRLTRLVMENSAAAVVLLTLALVCFSISAYYAWRLFTDRPAVPSRLLRWLPAVVFSAAFIVVPFNVHDINFYFSAGKAVHEGTNVYAGRWTMEREFFCPPLVGTSDGIMYGPLAIRLFQVVYVVSGGNLAVFVWLWKLLIAGGLMTGVYLVARLIRAQGTVINTNVISVFWVSQPLIMWEWLGNGHFDILWLVPVFLSLLLAQRQKWGLVIPIMIIGVWVKFVPLLLAPWFLLWWWQSLDRTTWKRQVARTGFGLAAAAAVTWLAWWGLWGGPIVFHSIILQTKWAVSSVFSAIYYSFKGTFVSLFADRAHWFLTRLVHLLLFTAVIYLLWPLVKKIIRVAMKKERWQLLDFIQAVFISMLVYLSIWQKSFWPWYISWLLPFGIMLLAWHSSNPYLKKIMIWLSVAPLYFYVVWSLSHLVLHTDLSGKLWFNYFVIALVWAYPVVQLIRWRITNYRLII